VPAGLGVDGGGRGRKVLFARKLWQACVKVNSQVLSVGRKTIRMFQSVALCLGLAPAHESCPLLALPTTTNTPDKQVSLFNWERPKETPKY